MSHQAGDSKDDRVPERKPHGEKDDTPEIASYGRTKGSYGCEMVWTQPVEDAGKEQYRKKYHAKR